MSALADLRTWATQSLRRKKRALLEPVPAAPDSRFSGLSTFTAQDPAMLLQEAIGWAAIAVVAISDRLAGLELEVCQRVRMRGRLKLDPIDDHPLAVMLRAGNPVHSKRLQLRTIASHVLVVGEGYWHKVRGTLLPVPVELWLGDPTKTRPLVDGPMIVGFEVYDGNGARHDLPAEDVVRVWWPDPQSIYTAKGKLGPQWITADSMKFSGQTLRQHFEHNAIPRVILRAVEQAATLDLEQQKRMNEYFRQRFNRREGGATAGLPGWLPFGFDVHELAALGGVEEVVAILDHWVDQLLAAFGVPRSVLGITDDAGLGRATAETNDWIMDTRAVKPVADLIADALTHQLAVPDFGEDLVVRFPDFAPADKEHDLKKLETELRTKLRSINEIREEAGDDPVTWGDLPVGSIGDAPYTGEEPEPLEPDDPTALGDDEPDEDLEDEDEEEDEEPRGLVPKIAIARSDSAIAAASWARFVARERSFVPRGDAALRVIFGIQERAALKAVRALDIRSQLTIRVDTDEIVDALRAALHPDRWRQLFRTRFEPIRTLAFLEAGQDALALVGYDPKGFKLSQRTAELLAGQGEEFLRLVSSTTIKRASAAVIRELAKGAQEGEGAGTRAQRVEQAVGSAMVGRRRQALTIARTEMLGATQRAQLEGFASSGVVAKKRWGTSRDDAVRDSHQIEGQTVGLNEDFLLPADPSRKLPAEYASAPGVGPNGRRLSAANAIGCRCFIRPVIEGD